MPERAVTGENRQHQDRPAWLGKVSTMARIVRQQQEKSSKWEEAE
jgi:hypothetical protein